MRKDRDRPYAVNKRNVQILRFAQDDKRRNAVILTEGKDLSVSSRDCVPPIPRPSALNHSPYFPTFTLTLAFLPLAVLTVMVAEPFFFAVTTPYSSTVATFLLEDFQV